MFESFDTLPAFASASKTQQASAKADASKVLKPSNNFIVEISYTLDVYFFEKNIILPQSLIFVDIAWKHL